MQTHRCRMCKIVGWPEPCIWPLFQAFSRFWSAKFAKWPHADGVQQEGRKNVNFAQFCKNCCKLNAHVLRCKCKAINCNKMYTESAAVPKTRRRGACFYSPRRLFLGRCGNAVLVFAFLPSLPAVCVGVRTFRSAVTGSPAACRSAASQPGRWRRR